MTPSITLTAYHLHDPDDYFEPWVKFVVNNIDARCGFEVEVDSFDLTRGPAEDKISNATDDQKQIIREALHELWEAFCATPA